MKNSQEMLKHMDVMQENMLRMHEHMHKIIDAKTPQEREQLMQAHREMLHQHTQTMKDGGLLDDGLKNGTGAARKK